MIEKRFLGNIYVIEQADTIRFGNPVIELVFSTKDGFWTGITDRRNGCILAQDGGGVPPVVLRVGGHRKFEGVVRNSRVYQLEGSQEIGYATSYTGYQCVATDQSVALEIISHQDNWSITSIYRLDPEGDTVIRDLRITYHDILETQLHDVRLLVPFVRLGEDVDTTIEAPGYPVTVHFPVHDINDGIWEGLDSRVSTDLDRVQHSVDAPGSVSGLVAVHNQAVKESLMCWPCSTNEFSIMEIEKNPAGIGFIQWLFLADRFTEGQTVEAGRQYLRLAQGSWEGAMQTWQPWFAKVGLEAPEERPDWAVGVSIYEVHVGRAPFLGGISYEPYPHMSDLVNDLPRIADLGFEVIQLMPHWPFCGYTVHDYLDIRHQYGDPIELKKMVDLAHRLGLKVILDVVLHGCVDKEIVRWDMEQFGSHYDFIFGEWLRLADEHSRYRDEHPEWFMQDECGNTARIYTWAFDHANRSYQDFMIKVLCQYLDDLRVDGFRFDAPTWNCMPNWARNLPMRPSTAYYAAYQLMKRIREAVKSHHPQALLYTEPGGPLFRNTMDLTYNYDEEWLTGSTLEIVSERGFAGARFYNGKKLVAKDIAEWMHYRRLSLPAGSMTVHHLDSHDTFWWGEKAQFRREAFGVEASRAMFAFFALVEGGIMNYVGSEKGSDNFYRSLLRLRQTIPVLRYGECDYLAVEADQPKILALLRSDREEHAIPVINLGKDRVEVHLKIPGERLGLGKSDECMLFDAMNHELVNINSKNRFNQDDLTNIRMDMPAFHVRILRVIPIKNEEKLIQSVPSSERR